MRFRVVTYNIHKGIGGVDRRYRPERIVETLSHCRPDLVLLQEVDHGVPRSGLDRQVDLVADALGFRHRAYQQNVKLSQGHYGNAVISRFPLADVHDIDLTVPLKKRRRALVCHCRLRRDQHERTLLLFNVHLGLAGIERSMQLQRILASDVLGHARSQTPVVLGGDFNDVWGRLGKKWLEPAGFGSACGRIKTFPAIYPVRPLDRMYYRGRIRLHHSFAAHTRAARHASDHLPLVADFQLPLGTDHHSKS